MGMHLPRGDMSSGENKIRAAARFHQAGQHAQAEAEILGEGLEGVAARSFVTFDLVAFISAKFDAGSPFGFRAWEAGPLEVVGAVLDVGAELVVHFGVDS